MALNPEYALGVLLGHPGLALVILGAVFLVLTGGEALYIDMGHFGRKPVRIAWFLVVWPGLLLNYFGQGALLLQSPAATDQSVLRDRVARRRSPTWSRSRPRRRSSPRRRRSPAPSRSRARPCSSTCCRA